MNPTTVTIVGNATKPPELKFTPSGVAVANFGVAVNNRRKDGDRWVDGDPEFYDVVCWRELAENVAECIDKGTRLVVVGRLSQRSWEAGDGSKRSKIEVVAEEVAPSLRWATASVVRNERYDTNQSAAPRREPAAPAYRPDEVPFVVDAGGWDPTVGYGVWPERMLP